jgi:hypothetical protein
MFAQVPVDKTKARLPWYAQPKIPVLSKPGSTRPEIESLRDLVARLLKYTAEAGCHKNECKILVAGLGQLAEELSNEFAEQGKEYQVIDPSLLRNLIEEDRIPLNSINEGVARLLASDLEATVVLVVETKEIADNLVKVSGRFLNVNDKNLIGPSAEVNLRVDNTIADANLYYGLPHLPAITATEKGEKVYQAGVQGVGSPACYYMPLPAYIDEGKFGVVSGEITVEAIVDSEGAVTAGRIVKGLPGGLNRSTLKSIKGWKCKPGLLDGKPVPTVVTFETGFHLTLFQ